VDNYTNVVYEFYNIHNIHVMRESLQKMVEAACSPTQSISGFLSGLEASGWMKHIHLILETSIFIAKVHVTQLTYIHTKLNPSHHNPYPLSLSPGIA